jgi:hypothetical protein
VAQIFGVNFRHRQAMAAKVFGKFEKGDVFFADAVQDADGADFFVGEADDLAAGTAELALERLDALGRCVKMLLKKLFENVHECG